MTTKSDLIDLVSADLDSASADMVAAIEIFRTAYRTAHANDLVRLKLGGQELGQRMDMDKLLTIKTTAQKALNDAGVALFDGVIEQPAVEAEAAAILSALEAEYPEAFAHE